MINNNEELEIVMRELDRIDTELIDLHYAWATRRLDYEASVYVLSEIRKLERERAHIQYKYGISYR